MPPNQEDPPDLHMYEKVKKKHCKSLHLLGSLDVEKFCKKLLPNLNVPPPLEATLGLPSIANLWAEGLEHMPLKSILFLLTPPSQCPCRW